MLRRDDRHLVDDAVLVHVEVDGRTGSRHLLLVLHEAVNSFCHQPLVRRESLGHVLDFRIERLGRADEHVFVHAVSEVERVVDGVHEELLVLFRSERVVLVFEDGARRIHLREEAVDHLLRRAEPVVVRVLHARLPALALRVFLVRLDVERLVLLVILQLSCADAKIRVVVVPVLLVDVVDVRRGDDGDAVLLVHVEVESVRHNLLRQRERLDLEVEAVTEDLFEIKQLPLCFV